jgi:signal peptidase
LCERSNSAGFFLRPVKELLMRKVAKSFGLAVVILLIAASAFTLLCPCFGWHVDVVFSGSMKPALNVGSMVITRPVAAQDINVGDIITFYSPLSEELTSHRVIGVENGLSLGFRTKGDANEEPDDLIVPAADVVGIICLQLPYFGYASHFVKTRLGLLLTLCLPGLIIIILEVINIRRILKEKEIEREYRIR